MHGTRLPNPCIFFRTKKTRSLSFQDGIFYGLAILYLTWSSP